MPAPTNYIQNLSATGLATNAFSTGVDSYGSFSGTNITATVNHVPVGTLMGISYTIHTEKQAQYTFGSPNVRRFTTGKRGIAGTLIFNTFDRAALISIFTGSNTIGMPLIQAFSAGANGFAAANQTYDALGQPIAQFNPSAIQIATNGNGLGALESNAIAYDINNAYANAFQVPLDYADQLPPFDVTLTMVDNQGAGAYMVIGGIEIMNEGGGFTVDDLTNQTAYTYVAKFIRPLTPIQNPANAGSN